MVDILKAGARQRPSSVLSAQPGRRAEAARKSRPPISPRRSTTIRSRSFRSSRRLFGTAANNGQMIAEVSAKHRPTEIFRQLAQLLTGRAEAKKQKSGILTPLLQKAAQAIVKRQSCDQCSVSVPSTAPEPRAAAAPAPAPAAPRRRRAAAGRCAGDAAAAERRPLADAVVRARRAAGLRRRWCPRKAARRTAPLMATDTRRSETYYETKGTIFGALIEAIDLAQLARLDADASREEIRDIVNEIIAIKNIVMSISEQEELLDDICNDVLGYGPLEPLLSARRHRRHHGERLRHGLHRSRRQDPEDRHPLPRQPAAAQYLPAHRQPDRPPRRRILADLRRAPAGRLPRQRHRAAARDRRTRRSPSASSRRTSSRSSSW